MFDQLLIAAVFAGLVFGLVFTRWRAAWVFVGAMAVCYFGGLVNSVEVLEKASNPGVITLVLLLLVVVLICDVAERRVVADQLGVCAVLVAEVAPVDGIDLGVPRLVLRPVGTDRRVLVVDPLRAFVIRRGDLHALRCIGLGRWGTVFLGDEHDVTLHTITV